MRRDPLIHLALAATLAVALAAAGCASSAPEPAPKRKAPKSVPVVRSTPAPFTIEEVPVDGNPELVPMPEGMNIEVVGEAPPTETPAAAAADSDAYLDERPDDAPQRIIVKWGIETAVDNFGYIVFRSEARDGEYKPITRGILPGVGTSSIPQVMRYADTTVEPGKTYFYRVEEIGRDGTKTMFKDDSNQVLLLEGTSKPMSRREMQTYAGNPFLITPTPR